MSLKIVKNYLTKNRCYIQNVKRKPIGIQIHSIGCAQGTAKAVCDYWNQSSVACATTYICDADTPGKVYQMLDESVYTWADAGYGNRNLITIEIAESDFMKYTTGANYKVTNPKLFKADIIRGYETAVLLCAQICKRYKWNPMSKLASGLYLISSHNEGRMAGLSSGHVDPDHVWHEIGKDMTKFRQDVVDCMKGGSFNSSVDWVDSWYRIRKNWKDPESQLGAYETVLAAKAACPYGYSVFDSTGKLVYKNNKRTDGTVANDFLHLTENDAAEKMAIYRKVTEQFPNDYRGWNNLGMCYFAQNNVAEARRCYTKALAIEPNNADVNYNAGVAAMADNDLKKAEEYLGKAAGTKGDLNAAMGTLYTMKGDYAKAKSAYKGGASNNAAVQQILNEDYAGARKTLAAVQNPNATTAYLLAIVGARTNDRDAVYTNMRTAVERDANMKARAQKDIEFAKFMEDDTFLAIIK